MGRSHEDYDAFDDAKTVSSPPSEYKQNTRSPVFLNNSGKDGNIQASPATATGALVHLKHRPGEESEEPVLFGIRREVEKPEVQTTQATDRGDMKKRIMSYLRSPRCQG